MKGFKKFLKRKMLMSCLFSLLQGSANVGKSAFINALLSKPLLLVFLVIMLKLTFIGREDLLCNS